MEDSWKMEDGRCFLLQVTFAWFRVTLVSSPGEIHRKQEVAPTDLIFQYLHIYQKTTVTVLFMLNETK